MNVTNFGKSMESLDFKSKEKSNSAISKSIKLAYNNHIMKHLIHQINYKHKLA